MDKTELSLYSICQLDVGNMCDYCLKIKFLHSYQKNPPQNCQSRNFKLHEIHICNQLVYDRNLVSVSATETKIKFRYRFRGQNFFCLLLSTKKSFQL